MPAASTILGGTPGLTMKFCPKALGEGKVVFFAQGADGAKVGQLHIQILSVGCKKTSGRAGGLGVSHTDSGPGQPASLEAASLLAASPEAASLEAASLLAVSLEAVSLLAASLPAAPLEAAFTPPTVALPLMV